MQLWLRKVAEIFISYIYKKYPGARACLMRLRIHSIVKNVDELPKKTQIGAEESFYEVPKTPEISNIYPLDESVGTSLKFNEYADQDLEGPYNTIQQDDIRPVE